MERLRLTLLFLVIACPSAVLAQSVVLAGHDLHRTVEGSSYLDFAQHPIPAEFFGPGSDPFTGLVPLRGEPLGTSPICPLDDLSQVDTIFHRQADADLPSVGSEATIPVEIVAMDLQGVAPVTVTFGGQKRAQQYTVKIKIAPNPPSNGSALLKKISDNVTTKSNVYAIWLTIGFFDVSAPAAEPRELQLGIPTTTTRYRMFALVDRFAPKLGCSSNVCANPDLPALLDGPGFHLELDGVCSEAPISLAPTSFGLLKGRFTD